MMNNQMSMESRVSSAIRFYDYYPPLVDFNEAQAVTVAGELFEFAEGETIHTENSYKYSVEEFLLLAERAGFVSEQVWTDDDNLFSVHCIRRVRD
jgi:uncharacterized SAM-dependent methyltransferase